MEKMCFLVLSLSVTFGALDGRNEPQIVTGRIVDTEGQPIAKAKVVLYYLHTRWGMGNRIAQQTESGTDGSFTFKEPLKYGDDKEYPYGRDSYVLLASHPGYAFGWKNIDREKEQDRYDITLTEPQSKTITVTDHDGNPLAGARVWPYSVGNRADSEPLFRDYLSLPNYVDIAGGTTGADGKAIIKNLPKTRSSFNASLKGYATGLSFGGNRPIRLSKGATVYGSILDEDRKPVAGALVKFHTEWMWNFFLTRTNSQGKFRLEDLPAEGWDMSPWGSSENANGIYVITIEHKDYIASETQDQFKAGQVVENFAIEAYRGTLVKCHVVDVKTNLPVAGARIGGSNESGRIDGRTDSDGVLTVRVMSDRTSLFFHSPPEGVYVLRGSNPPESRLNFDAQGDEMTVTMKSPPIAGRLTSVKGKVQLPDGSPAANVKISTTNSEYYETLTFGGAGGAYTGTGSDGSFELKDVPAGLKLFLYGHTKDSQYILAEVIENVEDPTVLSEPLVMKPGQVADVLLVNKRDEPCANMNVKVKPVMWDNRLFRANYHNARTDAEGRLKINGIIPGMKYYVMDSRAESGPRDMYYTQTITLIPLEPKERKITSFEGIDIDFDIDQAKGKMLLVCFWDMQQRPSRNCIAQLAKQAEQLKQEGVAVVTVQASKVDEKKLNEWVKKNNIPFPVGIIQEDEDKMRFTWGVRSLPWLILTDAEHIVHAVGFGIDQLDTELAKTDQPLTKEEIEKHQREVAEVEIRRLGGEIIVKTSENDGEYTEVKFLGPRYQNEWKGGNLGAKYLSGLCNLKNLRIQDVETFTDDGMVYLEGLNNLESLMLVHTQVTDNGLAHIKELTNLEFLGLMSNKFTDTGLKHIIGMTNLKSLRLDDTEVTNDGLKRLKENGLFGALEFLSLNRTKISNEGLAHLTGMQKLKRLYLSDIKITSVGLNYIKGLTKLEVLSLTNTDISDEGLLHLKTLTNLNMLYLRNTKITNKGLVHLEKMTNLIQLWIGGTKITDPGLEYLKALNKLESLDLSHTQVTNSGLSHLEGLTSLNELFLNYSGVNIDGYLDVNEALPDCQVYWEQKKDGEDLSDSGGHYEILNEYSFEITDSYCMYYYVLFIAYCNCRS